MALHDNSGSSRVAELDSRSKQIVTNIANESPRPSLLIGQAISLLENFKYQVGKLQTFGYCDHELAYVSFSVTLRLISYLRRKTEETTRILIEQIMGTIEHQKGSFETIRTLVANERSNLYVGDDDLLVQRFASLHSVSLNSPNSTLIECQQCDTISVQRLNQLLRRSPESVLLLDFRSRKEFMYSHLNFLNVVNIEPSLIRNLFGNNPDPSDMDLEIALEQRVSDLELNLFKRRFKFDLVVLYNLRFGGISNDRFDSLEYSLIHGDINGMPSQNPFKQLIQLLMVKNRYISSRLKQYPVYIRGGLEKWHQLFGEGALTSVVTKAELDTEWKGSTSHKQPDASHSSSLYLRDFGDYLASAKSSSRLGIESNSQFRRSTPKLLAANHESKSGGDRVSKGSSVANLKITESSSNAPANSTTLKSNSPSENAIRRQLDFKLASPAAEIHQFSTGLTNLGNSCYMNCILQCLSSTPQLTSFFFPTADFKNPEALQSYKRHINMSNHLGSKGVITTSFVKLLANMFNSSGKYFSPKSFKSTVGSLSPGKQFATYDQQDCIEFLTFILDALHEDLNQMVVKNSDERASIMELSLEQEKAREFLPVRLASTIEWERYLKLNFSVIVDYFQGQYLSRLMCLECKLTSTTYNAFSILSLPIPERLSGSQREVTLSQCLDMFTETELLDDDNKWHCPRCQKFTKLTKTITITRLPRVLIIHLKRFNMHSNGNFKKLETFVKYPVDEVLDLTKYWPSTGTYVNGTSRYDITRDKEVEILESFPNRGQKPPFRYQLYGVANHFGNLTTGHYTAFVKKGAPNSSKGWCYFDDAKVQSGCKTSQVLNKSAYCLFYLRID